MYVGENLTSVLLLPTSYIKDVKKIIKHVSFLKFIESKRVNNSFWVILTPLRILFLMTPPRICKVKFDESTGSVSYNCDKENPKIKNKDAHRKHILWIIFKIRKLS